MKKFLNCGTVVVTHTHTIALVLFMTLFGTVASGQDVGKFEVLTPVFDPNTGITSVTINWKDNGLFSQIPTNADKMSVMVGISGTAVCLNGESGPNATVVHPGFSNFSRNISSNTFSLGYFTGPLFTLPNPKPYAAPNTPFMVVRYRAIPQEPCTLSISGWVRKNNVTSNIISSSNIGTPQGYVFKGNIIKPSPINGQSCDDYFALGDAIPNVKISKVATILTPCFPGIPAESEFFPFGEYEFSQTSGAGTAALYLTPYRLTPSKTAATAICCGVDNNDYLIFVDRVDPWILGSTSITTAMFLAADFNGDGNVTTTDKLLIHKCALELDPSPTGPEFPANWLPWRFAPYATAPPDAILSTLPFNIPNYLDCFFDPLNGGLNVNNTNFWGVKRGDLNGSCESCGSSIVSGGSDDRTAQTEQGNIINLYLPEISLEADQLALIPIRSQGFSNASDILLELMADLQSLEVLSIENGDLSGVFESHGIVYKQNAAALKFGWFNMEPPGENIQEKATLFYVRVRAKKYIQDIRNSFWLRQEGVNLLLKRGSKAVSKFVVDTEGKQEKAFSAKLIGSNLVVDSPRILVETPAACSIKLVVVDNQGHQVSTTTLELPVGFSDIPVPNFPTQVGCYTLVVQSAFGQTLLRVVKL